MDFYWLHESGTRQHVNNGPGSSVVMFSLCKIVVSCNQTLIWNSMNKLSNLIILTYTLRFQTPKKNNLNFRISNLHNNSFVLINLNRNLANGSLYNNFPSKSCLYKKIIKMFEKKLIIYSQSTFFIQSY